MCGSVGKGFLFGKHMGSTKGPKVRTEGAVSAHKGRADILTLEDIDGRTRACKQALELRDGFLSDLGGADLPAWPSRRHVIRHSVACLPRHARKFRYRTAYRYVPEGRGRSRGCVPRPAAIPRPEATMSDLLGGIFLRCGVGLRYFGCGRLETDVPPVRDTAGFALQTKALLVGCNRTCNRSA